MGIRNNDIWYTGILPIVLLIRVILPPFEIYWLFQRASLLLIFSSTPSHPYAALLGTPKGSPKYTVGSCPTLHPNSTTNSSILCTSPTGIISHLAKLILNPDATSNQNKIQLKFVKYSFFASQKTIVSSAKSK